jgi:C4-type Zn-finger protein
MTLSECPVCKKTGEVEQYRRLTQYSNDENNYITCCWQCKKEDDAYWQGMWAEYYGSH